MKAVLVMFKSDGKRREFPLKPGTHVIGRQKTCRLRVPLPSVSRRHAELIVTEEGEVTVRDLGSSNGTFRNGARVEESPLEPGDELRIGTLDLILADGDDGEASAAAPAAPAAPAARAAPAVVAAASLPARTQPEAADAEEVHDLGDLSDVGDLDLDLGGSASGPLPGNADSASAAVDLDEDLLGSSGGSVTSPSPLGASASAIPLNLDDHDEDDDAAGASGSGPVLPPSSLASVDDDDDDDLDNALANFGKSDNPDGSSEFDFLADIEVLDDDAK